MQISTDELTAKSSPLPPELRLQEIFSFDAARYPFRELAAEVLGVDLSDLPKLHVSQLDRQPEVAKFVTKKKGKLHVSPFARRWHATQGSEARQKFADLLYVFVREFVGPRMAVEVSPSAEEAVVAYQRDVTFRVVEPSDIAVGVLHCDADYHHPPAEVNWWLPLTPVWDSNTLYIESAPGRADFQPVQMEYGQVLRFYGNLCQHHTVANRTESCRVSFDFRVLPLPYHDEQWIDQCGRECIFKVGKYYKRVLEPPLMPEDVSDSLVEGERRDESFGVGEALAA